MKITITDNNLLQSVFKDGEGKFYSYEIKGPFFVMHLTGERVATYLIPQSSIKVVEIEVIDITKENNK